MRRKTIIILCWRVKESCRKFCYWNCLYLWGWIISVGLNRTYMVFAFCSLFFNFFSSLYFWLFSTSVGPIHYFRDLQTSFFSNFFIKNGSHGTIHTFKNYFVTVFLVFSFQFQQNKFYPNGQLIFVSFSLTYSTPKKIEVNDFFRVSLHAPLHYHSLLIF